MGRPLKGWKLRPHSGVLYVYFTHNKRRVEKTTGCRDTELERASTEAARIYAEITSGKRERSARHLPRQSTAGTKIDLVARAWLTKEKSRLDEMTVSTYALYFDRRGDGIVQFFECFESITLATLAEYIEARLLKVRAQTVKHELSALRQCIRYAVDHGDILESIEVPRFDAKRFGRGRGGKIRKRSAAPELSPVEVDTILRALPESSRTFDGKSRWPVRARFVVAYETSLRPGLLDVLSVPEHYHRGSRVLRVPSDDDKIRFARAVPLSRRARDTLDAVIPTKGIIFGHHDFRDALRKAVTAVLGENDPRTKIFNGAHFRSARITHALERTGNLPGVQFLAGHKRSSTTAIYVRASERAARDVLEALGSL